MPGSEKSRCRFEALDRAAVGGVSEPIPIAGKDNSGTITPTIAIA